MTASLSAPPSISFEFIPSKTERMEQGLWQSIRRLAPLAPIFMSVTHGAGGSTRERTHATVCRIQDETGLPAAVHVTCVGATRDEIDAIAHSYWNAGIRHLVALRGDPSDMPGGSGRCEPSPGGYAYAANLVAGMRRIADFEISVAAYPESHPEAPSAQFDLDNLKRKVDAGATRAITHFFFDNDVYFRFLDRCAAAGIHVPVIPGILPITNVARAMEFAAKCGASMPARLVETFEGLDDDPETRRLVAATVAAEQCQALQAQGVRDFHFHTLNRSDITLATCHMLGIRAAVPAP
ncbi:methylenetetrahydrofolate reductase [NAD(P)H] [Azospirillum brasilense]|uniref:methylenetetrahydrofolate reductase [NAD(P)H] n=1 Tax=Azospirillum argentinense TaxID=2970906 RepID=UPI00190E6B3E|nr:methylenetetrahydrofolate reductase [NAD(P)H] [Azospirillum argentinense]MBK3802340.1 methylenetetrahydrofolate reductase [NAD(P)H] [Azospirillum argentinense]